LLVNIGIIMILLKYLIETISYNRLGLHFLDELGFVRDKTNRLIVNVGFDSHTHCIFAMFLVGGAVRFHLI